MPRYLANTPFGRRWAHVSLLLLTAGGALVLAAWAPLDETPKITLPPPEQTQPPPETPAPATQTPAQSPRQAAEGDQPYVPSRLEWLSIKANSTLAKDAWATEGFSIFYTTGGPGSDTIVVIANYDPRRVNRNRLTKEFEFARAMLEAFAKQHGWQGWLKIHEESKSSG